jgi:hypothetical protein
MEPVKKLHPISDLPDCHEGPDAFKRFDAAMTTLLAVPKALILRRQRAHRKKVDANPNRRGPKRKEEIEIIPDMELDEA